MTELSDDDFVEVWAGPEDAQDTARALLDAAEKAGERVEVVESLGGGGFRVPKSVASKAKLPKAADVEAPDQADDAEATDDGEKPKARAPRPRHSTTADDGEK